MVQQLPSRGPVLAPIEFAACRNSLTLGSITPAPRCAADSLFCVFSRNSMGYCPSGQVRDPPPAHERAGEGRAGRALRAEFFLPTAERPPQTPIARCRPQTADRRPRTPTADRRPPFADSRPPTSRSRDACKHGCSGSLNASESVKASCARGNCLSRLRSRWRSHNRMLPTGEQAAEHAQRTARQRSADGCVQSQTVRLKDVHGTRLASIAGL